MASDIEVTATITTDDFSVGDVYDAMRLRGDDISETSPISPGLREAAVVAGDDSLTLRVQGHDGEWSKQSQEALVDSLAHAPGVDGATVEVTSGGYAGASEDDQDGDGEPVTEDDGDDGDEPDADEEEEEEAAPGVETIDGVGADRAETLKEAGIETVDDVIDVGADGLVEAGISEGVAENIVESV